MTLYSYSATILTTSSPLLSLYEHRCHFDGGTAKMTRRWPVSELRSRWGLSASNFKLVSVLRNGWYNHIYNWSPINSANIHSVPVMSNMKLTIHVYDTRHQENQGDFSNRIGSVCLPEQNTKVPSRSQITLCLCYNRHCCLFWRQTFVTRCKVRT